MTLDELRMAAPDWDWSAERSGFSWRYRGTRLWEEVVVYRVAVVCGPSDDDFATQWRADNGETSHEAWSWLIMHGDKDARKSARGGQ